MSAEEIKVIKNWIDQGAVWPDAASGEGVVTPPDPKAVRLMTALREGDTDEFRKLLKNEPAAVNWKGPGGTTPLSKPNWPGR